MPREEDRVRLRHMLEAAEAALRDSAGLAREDLALNGMAERSLVRCLEVIGEAAAHVSPETRELLPELAWARMASMRNRLAHAYWDVDDDIVWTTVTRELPPLVAQLRASLSAWDAPPT
jgi:uncharacterized protein with HEPN domain